MTIIRTWVPHCLGSASLPCPPGQTEPKATTPFVLDTTRSLLPNTQTGNISNPFALPPGSQRYFCGMLCGSDQGPSWLGVTQYIGSGHRGIAQAMETVLGGPQQFVWSGELFVENRSGVPRLVSANPVSGYLYQIIKDPAANTMGHQNSVAVFNNTNLKLPFLIDRDSQLLPFDIENFHLNPNLGRITKKYKTYLRPLLMTMLDELLAALATPEKAEWKALEEKFETISAIASIIANERTELAEAMAPLVTPPAWDTLSHQEYCEVRERYLRGNLLFRAVLQSITGSSETLKFCAPQFDLFDMSPCGCG